MSDKSIQNITLPYMDMAHQIVKSQKSFYSLSLKALQSHAVNNPQINHISKNFNNLLIEREALALALEFIHAKQNQTDDSWIHPISPLYYNSNQDLVFSHNSIIKHAFENLEFSQANFPSSFSMADVEQVFQLTGIDCADFLTLPFVRKYVLSIIFNEVGDFEAGKKSGLSPTLAAQPLDPVNPRRYRKNKMVSYMIDRSPHSIYNGNDKEKQHLHQLLGGVVAS